MHVGGIRNLTDLPAEKVSAALLRIELNGMARQVDGMNDDAAREVQSGYPA